MRLEIDNRTGYLNDYYFQTLCLLYFPGEKFREGYPSDNYAFFSLDELDKEKHIVSAKVILASGELRSEAEYSEEYFCRHLESCQCAWHVTTRGGA